MIKKILYVVAGFVVFLGIGIGVMVGTLSANMKTIRNIPINDIAIDEFVTDTVRGEYYFEDQIGATVDVTIMDGVITEITFIEHICGKGEIAEVITVDIIAAQSLYVDDIAGATTSSHVIKLAIQDAMEELE